MTLLEKHEMCLIDLNQERGIATDPVWRARLDQKIADMKAAIAALSGRNKA